MIFKENIVLGSGIMARHLMFVLSEKIDNLTCIHSPSFAPACSENSTSINCLRGTQKGISGLGDLIVSGYSDFEKFYNDHAPAGIAAGTEIQLWEEGSETHPKWLRRYKSYDLVTTHDQVNTDWKSAAHKDVQAYFIDHQGLMTWYDTKYSYESIEDFVINIEKNDGYILTTKKGHVYQCKRLFACTSYMSDLFLDLCENDDHRLRLKKQKKVYGHFLHYKGDELSDLFKKDLCLSFDFTRLVYRKKTNEILISFSDTNKNAFSVSDHILKDQYNQFKERLNLPLPSYESLSLKEGIRSKGYQRRPFCEKINENLFVASGLYKNAYTFSYAFSQKINDLL